MSAAANTLENLNGMFKIVYGDKEQYLIPDGVQVLNMIPFSKKANNGKSYNVPIN